MYVIVDHDRAVVSYDNGATWSERPVRTLPRWLSSARTWVSSLTGSRR